MRTEFTNEEGDRLCRAGCDAVSWGQFMPGEARPSMCTHGRAK
jgi:hypothetical protein